MVILSQGGKGKKYERKAEQEKWNDEMDAINYANGECLRSLDLTI